VHVLLAEASTLQKPENQSSKRNAYMLVLMNQYCEQAKDVSKRITSITLVGLDGYRHLSSM
jgi:hypothetical protein